MVVQDLINELQKYPLDMKVLGRGYENGYNDIIDVVVIPLRQVLDNNWYDGEYQYEYPWDKGKGYSYTDCLTLT